MKPPKRKRYQLLAETNNGYRPTQDLIYFLWKLKVLDEYQCFYDAEATTNIIYFWLPRRFK